MTFASQYRTIVGPKLRRMCRWRGLKISLNEADFGPSLAEIRSEAYRLGAAFLPDDVREELDGQLLDWLITEIEEADALQIQLGLIWSDIADHDRLLAAHIQKSAPRRHWPDRVRP